MLCCTSNGNVFLYNTDPNSKKVISSSDEEKVVEYVHNNLKAFHLFHRLISKEARPPPAPGKMFANKKVNKVSLNPTDENLFITLENYNLHLWDAEQTKEPIVSKALSGFLFLLTEQIGYSPYYAAEWSPHVGNKLLIGGLKKSLKLIDVKLFGESESGPKPYVRSFSFFLTRKGLETKQCS